MVSRPFLLFIGVVTALTAGVIGFIQSAQFATLLKRAAIRYLPTDLGVEGDFSELSIQFYPPGLSVKNPKVKVNRRNFLDLPAGSAVEAQRIDFLFKPLQLFSSSIRVNQVRVVGGTVNLKLGNEDRHRQKHAALSLRWEDLLQVRADSFALENTDVTLELTRAGTQIRFKSMDSSLGQWSDPSGSGYELKVALRDIQTQFSSPTQLPFKGIEQFDGSMKIKSDGVSIQSIFIKNLGLSLKIKGTINGDLLSPKQLIADTEVDLSGDLAQVAELIGRKQNESLDATGTVSFVGKVTGDVMRPYETLHLKGALKARDFRLKRWTFDQIDAEGSWIPMGRGREISLVKAVLTSRMIERELPNTPGSGGVITIGPTHFDPESREPVTANLTLDRAHVQWLGAPAIEALFPLCFRASGPVKLIYRPKPGPGEARVQAETDLKVMSFQLDNQRLGKNRPMKTILKIPAINLKTSVSVDDRAIHFDRTVVSITKSSLDAHGKIDFKTGFDLQASGPIHLDEIGEVAGNAIRGDGLLGLNVHGPREAIFLDFDLDLDQAYYLHMNLGKFKGRVTWDDDPSHLIFKNVALTQGRTQYVGDGMLDLGPADSIQIGLNFNPGRIEDLTTIFAEFTGGLSWFPKSLSGDIEGPVEVSGGISLDRLKVKARFNGPNWDWLGERMASAAVVGGYDRGRYYIERFEGLKRSGRVTGNISFDPAHVMDWQIHTENFQVSDFDHVAQLDVPFRGSFDVKSEGHGVVGAISSKTEISVSQLSVRGSVLGNATLKINTREGRLEATSRAFNGQGSLDLAYDFRPGAPCYLRSELRQADFSPALLLLNPTSIQDPLLGGFATGRLDLTFASGRVEQASGFLELSQYLFARTGAKFSLLDRVSAHMENGTFDLPAIRVSGPESTQASLKLAAHTGHLDGHIGGTLDASILEFFTPLIVSSSGPADLDFRIFGLFSAPEIEGSVAFSGIRARTSALETPFENLRGKAKLKGGLITLESLDGDQANGRISATGTIEVFPDRYPKLNLVSSVFGIRPKIFPFQFVRLQGRLGVKGDQPPYLIDGALVTDSALIREKVANAGGGRVLKSAKYTPPQSRSDNGFPKFKLNIDVRADHGILIQNDLFVGAEAKAQVKLVNTIDNPRLLGTADLIKGSLAFKDREFTVQSGNMKFDNPAVINPSFTLLATTEVNQKKIQLYASGRLNDIHIDLSSNPVLSESDILSLLTLGATSGDVAKLRTGNTSSYEQAEAGSLVLHSLDFNRDVQDKTGLQIQVDEGVYNQAGSSTFRPANETEPGNAPKIVVKRALGSKATLSVGSTVGVGTASEKDFNLQYRVTPGFSVNGVWNSISGVGPEEPLINSYGVDLKLEKRFK